MKKGFALLFLILFLSFTAVPVFACTTCIIAGKATKDGRPLLLKNRDSDELQNKLMYFNDGIYCLYRFSKFKGQYWERSLGWF